MPGTTSTKDGAFPGATNYFAPEIGDGLQKPLRQESGRHGKSFAFAAVWLGKDRMTISVTDSGRTGIITQVTKRLKNKGINIENAFLAELEQSKGSFFEIAGHPDAMQELHDEITQNWNEDPEEDEALPLDGVEYEFEWIEPDRSGLFCDLLQRFHEFHLRITQAVVQTKRQPRGCKAIIFATITAPSELAVNDFKKKLDSIGDVPRRNWRCRKVEFDSHTNLKIDGPN